MRRTFRKLKEGNKVAVVRDPSEPGSFPKRIQGRTGVIKGRRGKSYIVEIKDFNKPKKYIIKPTHLKKLK